MKKPVAETCTTCLKYAHFGHLTISNKHEKKYVSLKKGACILKCIPNLNDGLRFFIFDKNPSNMNAPNIFSNCSHLWMGQQSSSVKLIWLENDINYNDAVFSHIEAVLEKQKAGKYKWNSESRSVGQPDHEKSLNDDAGCLYFRNGFLYFLYVYKFFIQVLIIVFIFSILNFSFEPDKHVKIKEMKWKEESSNSSYELEHTSTEKNVSKYLCWIIWTFINVHFMWNFSICFDFPHARASAWFVLMHFCFDAFWFLLLRCLFVWWLDSIRQRIRQLTRYHDQIRTHRQWKNTIFFSINGKSWID